MDSPGIVMVTEFCTPDDSTFDNYINYIDRDEAVRKDVIPKYNLFNEYMDYMDDTEKTSGLFTDRKDSLTGNEKKQLKHAFKTAQENGSLMWQTVISFDNVWLMEQGLYDNETKRLDESKIQAASRAAMNELLTKEGLNNAVWSAAIHYNTDNIHVHVATTEPMPTRAKKQYLQWEKEKVDGKMQYVKVENPSTGKREKVPVINSVTGEQVIKEEYIGVFKNGNIKAAKARIRESIVASNETAIEINNIIRDNILKHLKENELYSDDEFRKQFEILHQELARRGKRNMWNYNLNYISDLKPQIDELSRKYIYKYHKEDFKRLEAELEAAERQYQRAYGKTNDYMKNKMDDLYARMGNSILKSIKGYDKNLKENMVERNAEKGIAGKENNADYLTLENESEETDNADMDTYEINEKNRVYQNGKFRIEWSDNYKLARNCLYKTKDYKKAFELLESEAAGGNALALYDLADMYKKGTGTEINLEKSETYYKAAFDGFNELHMTEDKLETYLAYRIGKMYRYGLGVEKNIRQAVDWLEKASGNKYAQYTLGCILYTGEKDMVDVDYEKAAKLFMQSKTAYANYKLGQMYKKGIGVELAPEKSSSYYEIALSQFLGMERDEMADDNLYYRIGSMYMDGLGTEVDETKAIEYLSKAANGGNANAQYKLGKYYINSSISTTEEIEYAMKLLEKSATKGDNVLAQYALGKIYNDKSFPDYNENVAIYWFEKAAAKDNEFAQYNLGKIYTSLESQHFNAAEGIHWFEKSAAGGNEFAQYNLGKIYTSPESQYFNAAKGIYWFEKSAAGGNEFAQYNLGKIYTSLESQYFNAAKGIYWFEKSAAGGNEFAQYNLGKIYTSPESQYFNAAEGIRWFEKSAAGGNEFSNNALGLIYLKGEIVQRDIEKAKEYFEKSAADGNEFALEVLENIDNSGKLDYHKVFLKNDNGLRIALQWLNKSLRDDCEKWLNLSDYQELQQKLQPVNQEEL